MSRLSDYVETHTRSTASDESDAPGIDVLFFFRVTAVGSPTADALRQLLMERQDMAGGEGPDLLDGHEHGYIEIGAWVGSQGLALSLMGLGASLGLWQLLTPRNMLPALIPEATAARMAGQGYVTIVAPAPPGTVR